MVKDNSLYVIAIVAVVAVVGLVIMATGSTVVAQDSVVEDNAAIAGQATWAVMNAEGYALQHGSSACPELTDVENACSGTTYFSIEAAPDYHLESDLSQTTCTPCVVQFCNIPQGVSSDSVWSSDEYDSATDAYNAALAYAQDPSNDFSMFYAPWMSTLERAHCNDVNSDSAGVTGDTDDSSEDDSSGGFELEREFRGTIDLDEEKDDEWTLERSDKIFGDEKSSIRIVVPADSVQSFIEIDRALRQDTTREDLPEYELIVPQPCDGDWVPKNVQLTDVTSLTVSRLTAMPLTAEYSSKYCLVGLN